jgi:chemotaxis protein CheC
MIDVRELDMLQLDALREVASIGAGHAATALSTLTNRRIGVAVPETHIVRLEEVPELLGYPDEPLAAVLMQVLGDAPGYTVQLFPPRSASCLAEMLLHRARIDFPAGFGELEKSALQEVGNILAGAYMSALSDFLGMVLMISIPEMAIDQAGAILSSAYLSLESAEEYVFCIDAQLTLAERSEPLPAHFLFAPDIASLNEILRTLRLA